MSLYPSLSQGVARACQVSACARTTGPAIAVVAPSPRQPANRQKACCAAGGADACVEGASATTPGAPETSVRDVLLVKTAASRTGTCRFGCTATKRDGRAHRTTCDASSSVSLHLRKCVDCHLSHGLAQKEAGHCNNTCAPLVGYVDVVSGTATKRQFYTMCSLGDLRKTNTWIYRLLLYRNEGVTQHHRDTRYLKYGILYWCRLKVKTLYTQ